jgi:hypothetical protein
MALKSSNAGTLLRRMTERRNSIRAGLGEFVAAFRTVMKSLDLETETKALTELPPIGESEETMEEILSHLGDGYVVVRDVGCQFGKLDYLVLSRDHGLFLIETKDHAGRVAVVDARIRINGALPEEDFVSQALHMGYWLVEELRSLTGADVEATPLIVFTEATMEASRELKDVTLLNRRSLFAKLQTEGAPLPAPVWEAREKIAGLFTAAAAHH